MSLSSSLLDDGDRSDAHRLDSATATATAPHYRHGGSVMSQRLLWIATAALLALIVAGFVVFTLAQSAPPSPPSPPSPSSTLDVCALFMQTLVIPDVLTVNCSRMVVLPIAFADHNVLPTDVVLPIDARTIPTIQLPRTLDSGREYALLVTDPDDADSLRLMQINVRFDGGTALTLRPYQPPAPAPCSGVHRYTFLLFDQGQRNLTATAFPLSAFNTSIWLANNSLSSDALVAGTMFYSYNVNASWFSDDIVPNALSLPPVYALDMSFVSDGVVYPVVFGTALSVDDTRTPPTALFAVMSSTINTAHLFSVMLISVNASRLDYLIINIAAPRNGSAFDLSSGRLIQPYRRPLPPATDGAFYYVCAVFDQGRTLVTVDEAVWPEETPFSASEWLVNVLSLDQQQTPPPPFAANYFKMLSAG